MKQIEIMLHSGKYMVIGLTRASSFYEIHSESSILDLMSPTGVMLGVEIDIDAKTYRVRFYYDDYGFNYDFKKDKKLITYITICPDYKGRKITRL